MTTQLQPFFSMQEVFYKFICVFFFFNHLMLERVWRKGNLLTLLVGVQAGTATMENSMEAPQET